MSGVTGVLLLLMILAKRMESVGPFFRKVGAISLILVWVFLVTPVFSLVGLAAVFPERVHLIQLGFFSFIICGVFLLMAFVNDSTEQFRRESQARSASLSLRQSLQSEAVRVGNILYTREIYDCFVTHSHLNGLSEEGIPLSLERIMAVYSARLKSKEEKKLISFYKREGFDLRRISKKDEANLSMAKELMLVEECHRKRRWREVQIKAERDEAKKKAIRNLKILQRAFRA